MKNKTRKIIKLICAVLLVVVIQTMGYTYAKYITQETGSGRAEVAKWAFQIAKNGTETKTVKLVATADTGTLVNGKIAPGTSGKIDLTLDATGSEVDLEFDLKFSNEKNKPNNISFTYDGKSYSSLSEITSITGIIKHNDSVRTKDIRIYWSWNYETGTSNSEIAENDLLDTQDANSITEYTFDIIATGTQSE